MGTPVGERFYVIDYGDGTVVGPLSESQPLTVHTYAEPGTYTVRATSEYTNDGWLPDGSWGPVTREECAEVTVVVTPTNTNQGVRTHFW